MYSNFTMVFVVVLSLLSHKVTKEIKLYILFFPHLMIGIWSFKLYTFILSDLSNCTCSRTARFCNSKYYERLILFNLQWMLT